MPFMTSFGAFNTQRTSGLSAPLSENYVRYVSASTIPFYLTSLESTGAATNDKQIDYDGAGNIYTVLSTDTGTGPSTENRTIYINKYLPNRTLSICKSLTLPTTTEIIQSVNIFVDKTSNVPYIAIGSRTTVFPVVTRTTILALDSTLNLSWYKTYSGGNNYSVYITKDPAQSYLYVINGYLFILNASTGALITTYNYAWELGVMYHNKFGLPIAGPMYINGTTLSGGTGSGVLSGGLTTLTSASAKIVTTSNITLGSSTYNVSDGLIYATYWNTSTNLNGIYTTTFSGTVGLNYLYTFTGTPNIEFTGITNDGTYLYVTARSDYPSDNSYMFKFDTSLNYIGGYSLSVSGSINLDVAYTPFHSGTKTYTASIDSMWVMPDDMSTPGSGTYLINGYTWTKGSVTTPTRSTGTLAFSTVAATITTVTPTVVTQTLTTVDATNKLIYVGL